MKFVKVHIKITLIRNSYTPDFWKLFNYSVGKTCEECPFIDMLLFRKCREHMMSCRKCAFEQLCSRKAGHPYPDNKLVR